MSTRAQQEHEPRISIKMGRHYRQQTQQDLADALTRETGEHWSRGMVAQLEGKRKALTVDTLMAIAAIQQLPYSFYLEGPESDSHKGDYLSSATVELAA